MPIGRDSGYRLMSRRTILSERNRLRRFDCRRQTFRQVARRLIHWFVAAASGQQTNDRDERECDSNAWGIDLAAFTRSKPAAVQQAMAYACVLHGPLFIAFL